MRFTKLAIITALLLHMAIGLALGQGAPAQIETALLDLSARLGHSVSLDYLSNWRWEQTTFADSALGCPSYAGSGDAIIGYKFQLTYNAVIYDYRVSADNAIVVYCDTVDDVDAALSSVSTYSNALCPADASDGPYPRSRINFGMDIEVVQDFLNMRAQPATDSPLLLQIPPGLPFPVTAGPDCVDGYVWWLANFSGQTGYIAEAGDGAYFVTPARPGSMPNREILNTNLVPFVQELAQVRGLFLPQHTWSSDGSTIVTAGAPGSDSLWLYDLRNQVLTPQMLDFDAGLSEIAFQPNTTRLLIGSNDGTLHLWQILVDGEISASESLFLNAHGGAVSAIAFSPDGNRIVSAGPVAFSPLAVNRDWAAIVWDLPTVAQQALLTGHQALVRALVYHPDGNEIVTGADDGTLRFWDANSGAATSSMNMGAPITALGFSADGAMLAVGVARTSDNLIILDTSLRAQSASYPLPTNSVSAVDFSPDGSMLVVGAAEGVFTVWDTAARQLLLTRETESGVGDVSFSPDGTIIAASTEKNKLAFYGVPRGSG